MNCDKFSKKVYIFVQYRTRLTLQGSYLYPICDLDTILFLLSFILLLVFRFNSNYKSKKYCTVLIELDLLVFAGKLYLTTVQFPQHPTHLRQYIWFHLWIWNSRSFSAAAEILAVKLLPFVPAICLQIPGPVGQHTSTAAKLSTELRNWGKVPTSAFSLLKVLQCP